MDPHSSVLVVDQQGALGLALTKVIESNVVLVGGRKPTDVKKIHFLFYHKEKRHLPKIPSIPFTKMFLVWQNEKELLRVLPTFLEKAKEEGGVVLLLIPLHFYQPTQIEKIQAQHKELVIVVLGELFSKELLYDVPTPTGKILHQAVGGNVVLVGDGQTKRYPVFLPDGLEVLMQLSIKEKGKLLYLLPRHGVTELAMVGALQKKNPLLRVDFSKEKEKRDTSVTFLPGFLLLPDQYNWQKPIWETYKELTVLPQKKDEKPKRKKKSIKTLIWPVAFFCFTFLLLPFVATLLFSLFGFLQLEGAKNLLTTQPLSSTRQQIQVSQSSFLLARVSAEFFVSEAALFGKEDAAGIILEKINTGQEITAMLLSGIDASLRLQAVSLGKSRQPKDDIVLAANTLKEVYVDYQKLKEEERLPKDIVTKLDEYGSAISLFAGSQNMLPFLFGYDSAKNYLVLFQNNMELRPGGGFIGSYALVKVKDGKLMGNIVFHDVYDADGQLKGHVEPPFAIRRYVPQVHWYLRDSNFSLDSSQNASSAAFFADAEMGEQIDGVVSVDVSFLQSLLSATGPVNVPEYNETVTKDNMYLLTQKHAEKGFFAGSTQKKDFLKSLAGAIEQKFVQGKDVSYPQLAKVLAQNIVEKHVQLAVANSRIQKALVVNGFSSDVSQNLTPDANISDFLGITEANLGVNKANYFLKRKIAQQVSVEEGVFQENTTIYYKNTSDGSWPGGSYKTYLRVALPNDAVLTSIAIDGNTQAITDAITDPNIYEAKTFVPSTGLEVEKSEENGRALYGFLVIVPTKALKTVRISYALPFPAHGDTFSYGLSLFKQPGITDFEDAYEFSVKPQSGWKIVTVKDESNGMETKVGDAISIASHLKSDFPITVTFTKK